MNQRVRFFLALLLPFVACGLQWLLWEEWISPYVWFLALLKNEWVKRHVG